MNASSSESDDLSEADERLRRLIAHWMSPCDASQLNEEQVEALLHEPFDCTLSDDQMELILRKATAKIHAGAPGAPACGSRVDETAGDLGPLVPPVADESLTPGSAPPSPVLGFLDGVANLGSFTPTFWTLLAMVFGHRADAGLRGRPLGPRHPRAGRCPGRRQAVSGRRTSCAFRDFGACCRLSCPLLFWRCRRTRRPMAAGAIPRQRSGGEAASGRGRSSIWRRERPKSCSRPARSRSSAGPAKLEIDSPNSVRLVIGCLSVRADTPVAHGFTVHSGSASLIDLGTEFHVQAAAEGHSEVYVTVGAVEVRAHPGALSRVLNAGQAAHIETGSSGVVALIEAGRDTPDFVFPTIKPPSARDYADASQHHASIRVVRGNCPR